MNKQGAVILLLTIAATTLYGCGKLGLYNADKGEMLASVGDKELYLNDIQYIFQDVMTHQDSIALIDKYVDSWVKNEIKIAAAEAALSQHEEEIEELVNQYRTSLITFKYEDDVIKHQIDTLVTKEQIDKYYNENKDNFRLAGPVVKAIVVRLPKKLRLGRKFEDMFMSDKESAREEFLAICQKNNYRLDDFTSEWTDFSTVVARIPFTHSNFDEFLKTKRLYEVEDDQYRYMMRIISYLPTGDYSPAGRETANIHKILLNLRRANLVRNLEDSLMKVAQEDNTIKINRK